MWLEPREGTGDDGPLAAWLSAPPAGSLRSRAAALVLPAFGYAYSSSHRQWGQLAEGFAAAGIPALRIDYWGTGDSDGRSEAVESVEPWQRSIERGIAELRANGAEVIVLTGLGGGGLLAHAAAAEFGADGIVTIGTPTSARRFVRGLTMLGTPAPGGAVSHGGYYFSAPLLADIERLQQDAANDIPLLQISDTRVGAFLERAAEEAITDPTVTAEAVDWTRELAASATSDTPASAMPRHPDASTTLSWQGTQIREAFVRLGPLDLAGVLTSPVSDEQVDAVFLLVNSGSDPHSGPGRAWVELARHLASEGLRTLRFDMRGWGESDAAGPAGRPYDAQCTADVIAAVEAIRSQAGPIYLGGLCAGAWASLDILRMPDAPVDGVVALNPQLYWQPGDPVEALMTETRRRRRDEIAQIKSENDAGRWDAEDRAGIRPPAAAWLDALVEGARPVSLVFAAGDDGIEYLEDRLHRRLTAAVTSGVVTVTEVPGIDHGMHDTWARPEMFDTITRELLRFSAEAARVPS